MTTRRGQSEEAEHGKNPLRPRRTRAAAARPRAILILAFLAAFSSLACFEKRADGPKPLTTDVSAFVAILNSEKVPDSGERDELFKQLEAVTDQSARETYSKSIGGGLSKALIRIAALPGDTARGADERARQTDDLRILLEDLQKFYTGQGQREAFQLFAIALKEGLDPATQHSRITNIRTALAGIRQTSRAKESTGEDAQENAEESIQEGAIEGVPNDAQENISTALQGLIDLLKKLANADHEQARELKRHASKRLSLFGLAAIAVIGLVLFKFFPRPKVTMKRKGPPKPGNNVPQEDLETRVARIEHSIHHLRTQSDRREQPDSQPWKDSFDELSQSVQLHEETLEALRADSPTASENRDSAAAAAGLQLQKLAKRISALQRKTEESFASVREERQGLIDRLATSRESSARIEKVISDLSTNRVAPVDLELRTLRKQWERALSHDGLAGFLDRAEKRAWDRRFFTIRKTLMDSLAGAPELSAGVLAITKPIAQASRMLSKLAVMRKMLDPADPAGGEIRVSPESGDDVFPVRDFSFHLFLFQTTEEGHRVREFQLAAWARERFRGFADQFFREFWLRQLDNRHGELLAARDLVAEILAWGGLEVVEITPGQTPFDSRQHIGRSTTSDPGYPDSVVMSVLKAGFRETSNQRLVQTPEVVVNRR